jgi:hypothetical protein
LKRPMTVLAGFHTAFIDGFVKSPDAALKLHSSSFWRTQQYAS